MWIPICNCEEGKDLMKASITEELPKDWHSLSQRQRECETVVRCGHCKKILKYPGTTPWIDPRTGEPGYRTPDSPGSTWLDGA